MTRSTRPFLGTLHALLPLLGLCALAAHAPLHAADGRWGLCPPSSERYPLPELGDATQQELHLTADLAEMDQAGQTRFLGDVVMLHAGKRLEASQASHDKTTDVLELSGGIRLYTADLVLEGEHARLDLGADQGEIQQGRYHLRAAHAFGEAETLQIQGPQHLQLNAASYTTCDPAQVDWELRAGRIDLDEATNTGEARDVTVRFKGMPILYLPYLNFPLQGRKSGLLAPTLGSSDKNGSDIALPYYWNLAPHRDATTTPRYLSRRGAMLLTEFRYLNPNSAGQLNLDYLPGDRRRDGEDRLFGSLKHQGASASGWNTTALYQHVSDTAYFNDLGNNLVTASTSHLERRLDIGYRGEGWSFLGRAQGYQTLSGDDPYQRLPQLRLDAASPRGLGRLRYTLASELVRFAHRDETLISGNRLDLQPALSYPVGGAAWFLTPTVALRHTRYQLEQTEGNTDPSRTLPILSLDSGLFFERALNLAERPLLQTLEPRLYYLHVPYRAQDELPVFDTAELDFTFSQLFRDNRFGGADRMGDAHQITLALTSRLLDGASGSEVLRGSIGQIHYLETPRVTLPDEPVPDAGRSDLVAELAARPWRSVDLAATVRWDPEQVEQEVFTTRLRYRPEAGKLLGLSYRERDAQQLRQTDLVAYWPLSSRWRLLGRWNYDLELERSVESLAGVAYETCCWALHLIARERLDLGDLDSSRSIMLTLELKGLSSLGHRLEDELPRGILRAP